MGSALTLFAAGSGQCADRPFLGLVPWYHYLNMAVDPNSHVCEVTNFTLLGSHSGLLLILLAVVDDLLRIAGFVAVIFVIYAGIKFITSQGSPDETAKAQSTIINALIGLAIALVAVGVVSFIGNQLTSTAGGSVTVTNGATLNLSSLPNTNGAANGDVIKTALSVAFGIVGALSLLFVIIGGFRYVVSQGDPQNVNKAKGTIFYALIGLAVAIVAESIVSFVIGRLVP